MLALQVFIYPNLTMQQQPPTSLPLRSHVPLSAQNNRPVPTVKVPINNRGFVQEHMKQQQRNATSQSQAAFAFNIQQRIGTETDCSKGFKECHSAIRLLSQSVAQLSAKIFTIFDPVQAPFQARVAQLSQGAALLSLRVESLENANHSLRHQLEEIRRDHAIVTEINDKLRHYLVGYSAKEVPPSNAKVPMIKRLFDSLDQANCKNEKIQVIIMEIASYLSVIGRKVEQRESMLKITEIIDTDRSMTRDIGVSCNLGMLCKQLDHEDVYRQIADLKAQMASLTSGESANESNVSYIDIVRKLYKLPKKAKWNDAIVKVDGRNVKIDVLIRKHDYFVGSACMERKRQGYVLPLERVSNFEQALQQLAPFVVLKGKRFAAHASAM